MTSLPVKIFEYIGSSRRFFTIPSYQRSYNWDIQNIKDLFKDLEEYVINSSIKPSSYYFGNILLKDKMHTEEGVYIIDGQQRFTTCLLIAKALLEKMQSFPFDEEDQNRLLELKSVFSYNKNNKKLKLNNLINEHALELILSSSTTQDEDKETSFYKNYSFIKKYFENKTKEEITNYFSAFYKLEVVLLFLDDHESEHLIFESINSKGKSLLQSDLIKNYIFYISNEKDGNEIVKYYNDTFINYFKLASDELEFYRLFDSCELHSKAPESKTGKKIYESFKNSFNQKHKFSLDDLNKIKKFYAIFKYIKDLVDNSSDLSCKYVVSVGFATYFPWIYQIIKEYMDDDCFKSSTNHDFIFKENKKIAKEFKLHFKIMATYDISRVANGYNRAEATKSIHNIFPKSKEYFEINNIKNPTEKDFLNFFENENNTKAYQIPLPKLEDDFKKVDMYKESKRTKVILWLLENSKRQVGKFKWDAFEKNHKQIEHILPQKAINNNDWKNYFNNDSIKLNEAISKKDIIGNLTVLSAEENGYNSDSVYDKKKNVFSQSSLWINKNISNEYSSWDAQVIDKRTKEIYNFVQSELIAKK